MTQPTQHDDRYHKPVMVEEVLSWLAPARQGWIIDGTFGGGGHSRAILDSFPGVSLIGLDRDPDAISHAFSNRRLTVVTANYRDIDSVLASPQFPDSVDGILLDLGVSSHQLDVADRGFSYHSEGPLDMRMGPDAERTAADIVNTSDTSELESIFRRYGEERFARRIAAAIVEQRPFETTGQLSSCISSAVPAAARRAKHPARKVFQALRIAVNDELTGLADAMESGLDCLARGGRAVVMAYHSLEDRIVKRAFAARSRGCVCPPDLPQCACGANPEFTVLTPKAIKPSAAEVAANPRARSAVLRVLERKAS
jgi:16S rRNA (cytosine1402-N4)-methyltransferase